MTVVLLHALARTPRSMRPLARHLEREGYETFVPEHPSTRASLLALVEHVLEALAKQGVRVDASTSFVGHSLGGLVYRALTLVEPTIRVGPSVTIGTPTNGSIVAETLARFSLARLAYGPVLAQLAPREVVKLPPFPGPTLTIAGSRATPFDPAYWVLRAIGERRASDSTVLVEEALHEGAVAQAVVPGAHPFLPSHPEVMRLVADFLRRGSR